VKEFKPGGDLTKFLGVGVAYDEEVIGANAAPVVSRLGRWE
jgi:hypothetical protein